MSLYENAKSIAKSKGYSINQLEKELGFARSYISKFQKITPSVLTRSFSVKWHRMNFQFARRRKAT